MKKILGLLIGVIGMTAIPAVCFGQDGSDINQAIPMYFGQTVNDTIDNKTNPRQIYSITLAKGQQLNVVAKGGYQWGICLHPPGTKTTVNASCVAGQDDYNFALQFGYTVATAGTYYLQVYTYRPSTTYTVQVTATGTPIATPNPTSAGCLTGQVDSITYSLQLIAASLPDEASIGGTKLCSTCTVKPPAYPQLVNKLETAMGLNVGVSACYDAAGSIFQLKLIHP